MNGEFEWTDEMKKVAEAAHKRQFGVSASESAR